MAARKITYSSRPTHAARLAHAKGERMFKTYDTSHIRPKKSKAPLVFGAILALLMFAGLIFGGSVLLKGCSAELLAEGEEVQITIPDGSGARDIGDILQKERIVANSRDFATRVSELAADAKLKPGTYVIPGGLSLDEVIGVLCTGPNADSKKVVIPEGFTLEQMAASVEEASEGAIAAADFLALAKSAKDYEEDYPFVKGAYDKSLEGFLFPKTYPITDDSTADSVIRMMLTQYQIETADLDYTFAEEKGLSRYEVLVMASLIEREATLSEERPMVSMVIYNRLADEMLLQIDAAVAYGVGVIQITPDDLEVDTPYNTYMHVGLPPGPICSPGLESIEAALSPDPEAAAYYYYVVSSKGDGSHDFSATYEEHQAYIDGAGGDGDGDNGDGEGL